MNFCYIKLHRTYFSLKMEAQQEMDRQLDFVRIVNAVKLMGVVLALVR